MAFVGLVTVLIGCGSNNAEPATSEVEGKDDSNGEIQERTVRFAHTYPVEEPVAKGVEKFSELVAEKSDGKVNISVFPSGQLYNDQEMPEALTTGQVEMGMNTVEMWSGQIPAAEFTVLPLFSNYDQVHWALDNGIVDLLTTNLNEIGVEPLFWADFGFGYFASKDEPLISPENFEGKRVRTTSPVQAKMVELAGGTPITMGGAEVAQALQRGTIDAALSGITAFVALQYHQNSDYYSGPLNVGLISASTNLDWWNKLSEAEKSIIKEASHEAQLWISEEVEEQVEMDRQNLKSEGMEYVEVDNESFDEIYQQLIQDYITENGEDGKKIIEITEEAVENIN